MADTLNPVSQEDDKDPYLLEDPSLQDPIQEPTKNIFPDQNPQFGSPKMDPKVASFISEAEESSNKWLAKTLDNVDAIEVPKTVVDKKGMRELAASYAVIQQMTGVAPVEAAQNLQLYRKGIAEQWGENEPRTNSEFLDMSRRHVNGAINYGTALTNAFNQGITDNEDPKNIKNPILGEQEWRLSEGTRIASFKGGTSPMQEREIHNGFSSMYDQGAAIARSPMFPLVKETFNFFRGGITPEGSLKAPSDIEQGTLVGIPQGIADQEAYAEKMRSQILGMTDEQQNQFFSTLAQYSAAKGEDKASIGQWFSELGQTLSRGISETANAIMEPPLRSLATSAGDLGVVFGNPDMTKDADNYIKDRDIQARLKDAADNVINPLHEYGVATDIARGVVGALPWMAAFAVDPYVGIGAMGLSNIGNVQKVLRQNNPGMSQAELNGVSVMAAAPMTALQSISMGSAFKAFPWLEQRLATSFGGGIMNQAAHIGVTTAGMNLADATQIVSQKVAQIFDPELKMGSSASVQLVDLMLRLPESAATFAIITLAGAGVHKLQGGKNAAQAKNTAVEVAKALRDEQGLRAMGWSNEMITEAQNVPLSEVLGTVIEINGRVREDAVKNGQEIASKGNILSRLFAESPETPTMLVLEDGTYRLMVPDSKGVLQSAGETADFEVANSRLKRLEEFYATKQIQHFNQLIDYMQGVWDKQGIENRTVETPSEPYDPEYGLKGKTVQDYLDEKESKLSEAELRLRVTLAGGHENDSLSSSIIEGYTTNEWKNKVYTDIIKVLDTNPKTFLHESSDAHTNRAIAMGKFTHQDLIGWIRKTEAGMKAIDGKEHQYLDPANEGSNAAVVEAHTQLFLEYAGGKFAAYKAAPSALRSFFKSMLRYFQGVLAKAKVLHQAIEAGTVPREYQQHLAETMGLEIGERLASREGEEVRDLIEDPVQRELFSIRVKSVAANILADNLGIPGMLGDEYIGRKVLLNEADLTAGGGDLNSRVPAQGGSAFSFMKEFFLKKVAWASSNNGIWTMMLNRARKEGAIYKDADGNEKFLMTPYAMKQDSHNSNASVAGVKLDEVERYVKEGRISDKQEYALSGLIVDAASANFTKFSERLTEARQKLEALKKSGASEEEMKDAKDEVTTFQAGKTFNEGLMEFPRKFTASEFHDFIEKITYPQRSFIIDKLSSAEAESYGAPPMDQITRQTRDESHHGTSHLSMLSVLEIDVKRLEDGLKNNTLKASDFGVPRHNSYDSFAPGRPVALFRTPVPYEYAYPTIRQDLLNAGKDLGSHAFLLKGRIPKGISASQTITKEMLDNWKSSQIKLKPNQAKAVTAALNGEWKVMEGAGDAGVQAFTRALYNNDAASTLTQYRSDSFTDWAKNQEGRTDSVGKFAQQLITRGDMDKVPASLSAWEKLYKEEVAPSETKKVQTLKDELKAEKEKNIQERKAEKESTDEVTPELKASRKNLNEARKQAEADLDGKLKSANEKLAKKLKDIDLSPVRDAWEEWQKTDLSNMLKAGKIKIFKLGEMDTWFALKRPEGNEFDPGDPEKDWSIVGVANNEGGSPGMLPLIMAKAIKEGGTRLDCFEVISTDYPDGLLPTLYSRSGFELVNAVDFDASYHQEPGKLGEMNKVWESQGWDGQKEPRVVWMKYNPEAYARIIENELAAANLSKGKDRRSVDGGSDTRSGGLTEIPTSEVGSEGSGRQGRGLSDGSGLERNAQNADRILSRGVESVVAKLKGSTDQQLKALGLTREAVDSALGKYDAYQEQGISFSIRARDEAYDKAVKSGDTEAQQRLVNEAAKEAGYGTRAYHGTPNGDFQKFEDNGRGFFFTDKEHVAKGYTYKRGLWLSESPTGKVVNTHLKMDNPLEIDAMGSRYNNIRFPGIEWKKTVFGNLPKEAVSVSDAALKAFEMGHDSVIVRNVMDAVDQDDKTRSTVYVVKNSEQIKSADPITRNSDSKVIPLSQRFNPESNNISFSIRTKADADKVNAEFERQMIASPTKRREIIERAAARFGKVQENMARINQELASDMKYRKEVNAATMQEKKARDIEDIELSEKQELRDALEKNSDKFSDRLLTAEGQKKISLEAQMKDRARLIEKGIKDKYAEKRKAMEQRYSEEDVTALSRADIRQEMEQNLVTLGAIIRSLPQKLQGEIGTPYKEYAALTNDTAKAEFLTTIIGRMTKAIDNNIKGTFIEKIEDALQKGKPKSGKKKIKTSRFGADAQDFLDAAYRASLMDNDKVAKELESLEKQINDAATPEDESELVQQWGVINTFGDLYGRTALHLENAYKELTETMQNGRTAWRMQEQERVDKIKGNQGLIEEKLPEWTDAALKRANADRKTWGDIIRGMVWSHTGYEALFRRILPKGMEPLVQEWSNRIRVANNVTEKDTMMNWTGLIQAIQRGAGGKGAFKTAEAVEKLRTMVTDKIFKIEGRRVEDQGIPIEKAEMMLKGEMSTAGYSKADLEAIADELASLPIDSKKQFVTITRVIKEGTRQSLPMSLDEMIFTTMAWEQADVRAKMEYTGWTDEAYNQMVAEINASPVASSVRDYLKEFYKNSYDRLNEVHMRMFGMRMADNPNYAPTSYETKATPVEMSMDGISALGGGTTPGFLKPRVKHSEPFKVSSATDVYQQNSAQQSHWVSFAELVREISSTFNGKDVRLALKGVNGIGLTDLLNQSLKNLAQGGGINTDPAWVKRIGGTATSGTAIASMAYNLKSIANQLESGSRFLYALPLKDVARALSNPTSLLESMPKVWNSETVQNRLVSGSNPAVRFVFQQSNMTPNKWLASFYSVGTVGMEPMQYADAALTTLSSAIVYRDAHDRAMKAGLSEKDAEARALDAMDAAVYRYSQPVMFSAKSSVENNANATMKLLFMFMSDPRLKTGILTDSVASIVSGKGNKADHYRRIGAVMLGALISQTVSNVYRDTFSDDADDKIWTVGGYAKALALAPLQGFFLLGTAVDVGLSSVSGQPSFQSSSNPLVTSGENVIRAVKHSADILQTDDMSKWMDELNRIARAAAVTPMTAVPAAVLNLTKPVRGAMKNVDKED